MDQSVAGTEGPCPSCGARIVAPPVEVPSNLVQKQASPIEIKPREAVTRTPEAHQSSELPENRHDSDRVKDSEPAARGNVNRRSVSPTAAISHEHNEKQDALVFLKILAAVSVVAAIVFVVWYVLRSAS